MFSKTKTLSSHDETLWAAMQDGAADAIVSKVREKVSQLCRDFPAYD